MKTWISRGLILATSTVTAQAHIDTAQSFRAGLRNDCFFTQLLASYL